jgi:hypothetical protein
MDMGMHHLPETAGSLTLDVTLEAVEEAGLSF